MVLYLKPVRVFNFNKEFQTGNTQIYLPECNIRSIVPLPNTRVSSSTNSSPAKPIEAIIFWIMTCNDLQLLAVADPGVPRGGGTNSPGGHQHTISPNFPKNCMKLKEFGPPGSKYFQFHAVLGKFGKIVCWRPRGIGAPSSGNS